MKHNFLTVLLALVATLCLCFGLAACGESGGANTGTGSGNTEQGGTDDDLWTAERLYAEAKELGFKGTFEELIEKFKGEAGKDGVDGKDGTDGKDGANGKDGIGIASVEIDENGHLQITLTDGNVIDAGLVSGAPAQTEGTEGLAYRMRRSPTGEETLEVAGIGMAYECDIVIPSTYRGIPVTAIAGETQTNANGGAFFGCDHLTSITIPDSMTSIGGGAFKGCSGLTGVYITDLAAWCSIDFRNSEANPLYYAHNLYLDNVEVKDLTIPAEITEVKPYAFYGCSGLESVTIGSGVTSMGDYAFYGCSGLTGVYITDLAAWCSIDFGGSEANPLYHAHHLYLDNVEVKDLTIPAEITEVKPYAFYGCSGLESVTIGSGVTSIGDYAFYGCSGLTGVYITDLAAWCSIDCRSGEANPLYHVHHLYLDNVEVKDLTIPAEITEVKPYAFFGCSGLESVTIESGVTSIGDDAFFNCSGLTKVTIGSGVTSIRFFAFYNCSGLTSIVIPDSVTSIWYGAFVDCNGLESVYYKGTPSAWKEISIDGDNSTLTNATRYYYSAQMPSAEQWAESPNWWHYEADGETIVLWTKEQA